MSPEQARGRAADKRSDVWAFGSVLYEMLTGRRAFQGDDVTDTLAAVMRSDPDWSALPASLHPAVRALLQGCLEKDRRKRIGDVSAALFVLGQQGSTLAAPSLPVDSGRQRSWQWPLLLLGGAVVGAMATGLWMRQPLSIPPVTRFTVQVPEGLQLSMSRQAIAISPDGSRIVIGAQGRLFLRSVAEFDSRLIPTAEVAIQPAFSPDGQSILFWADGALKRMAVTGGVPVLVCEATPAPFGVSWGPDGILFLQPGRGIMRVSPNGGTPTPLLSLTEVDGLATRAHLLPDGDTLLFTLARGISTSSNSWDRAQIVIHSLRSGQRRTLIEGGSDARFVPTGHIVYSVEGTVMAVPFDVGKLQVTGGPVPIVEGVRRTAPSVGGEAQFVFSASGTLVYLPGPARTGKDDLFLYDRKGDLRP
jgi:serine/threonine-protein kinase